MTVNEELKETLRALADAYETADFSAGDPSCVLKRYADRADAEAAAFIAAMLSFGRREQFLKKICHILDLSDKAGGPAEWLRSGRYETDFIPPGAEYEAKFYRFYSYADMLDLFSALRRILQCADTLGSYFEKEYGRVCTECVQACGCSRTPQRPPHLAETVSRAFCGCAVVPQGKNSANKRIHMFLRWMVRRDSPVDLGFWQWYSPAELLIPLDTHVVQESVKLGLLPESCAGTAKTAALLTERLKQVWPDDPCRGDFALFGLGVDEGVR